MVEYEGFSSVASVMQSPASYLALVPRIQSQQPKHPTQEPRAPEALMQPATVRPSTRPMVYDLLALLGKVLRDRALALCFVPPGLGVQLRLFAGCTGLPLLLQVRRWPVSLLGPSWPSGSILHCLRSKSASSSDYATGSGPLDPHERTERAATAPFYSKTIEFGPGH
ncbi:hypothetical protein FSARC_4734 [Fusarium sarcochroum]|uniref:Uncharacterized protein n=1 Tax=Fusarium sarcochroum TaxID=1208366 RepID=A0A8H4XAZ2_9HYPO|nr:hypothetical protein FSARC_4734 [Fusarium sarcochroum]